MLTYTRGDMDDMCNVSGSKIKLQADISLPLSLSHTHIHTHTHTHTWNKSVISEDLFSAPYTP